MFFFRCDFCPAVVEAKAADGLDSFTAAILDHTFKENCGIMSKDKHRHISGFLLTCTFSVNVCIFLRDESMNLLQICSLHGRYNA